MKTPNCAFPDALGCILKRGSLRWKARDIGTLHLWRNRHITSASRSWRRFCEISRLFGSRNFFNRLRVRLLLPDDAVAFCRHDLLAEVM